VIVSLNKLTSPDNTNVAEAAHALSNRREKNLKLVTTIFFFLLGKLIEHRNSY
ncbi:hypothetical protein C1645_794867, partial [Glomus cerebriforme]